MKSKLPKGIRRIFSAKTGKVTYEVLAGVVHGNKIRKQFGEATYGSQDAALEAAENWYAVKREEILESKRREPIVTGQTSETLLNGSESNALEAAKSWYAIKREEIKNRHLRNWEWEFEADVLDVMDVLFESVNRLSESVEKLELEIKALKSMSTSIQDTVLNSRNQKETEVKCKTDELISLREAARICGLESISLLRGFIKRKELRVTQLGYRTLRIHSDELSRFIKHQSHYDQRRDSD